MYNPHIRKAELLLAEFELLVIILLPVISILIKLPNAVGGVSSVLVRSLGNEN